MVDTVHLKSPVIEHDKSSRLPRAVEQLESRAWHAHQRDATVEVEADPGFWVGSVVDFNPRIVADAAKCLSLGKHTRRARPKSFLRRPPRARRRPSEPQCCASLPRVKRLCAPRRAEHPVTFCCDF
eukprot:scaffold103566_cov32-Phaeocystis_antarctica.AAC.1